MKATSAFINKIKQNKLKALVLFLVFAVLITTPIAIAGITYAKYANNVTYSLSLNAEYHYYLNKEKMWAALDALETAPSNIKVVMHDFDTSGLTLRNENIGNGKKYKVALYQSADGDTVYITQNGPDIGELTFAPVDSSHLFSPRSSSFFEDISEDNIYDELCEVCKQYKTIDLLGLDTSMTTNMSAFFAANYMLTKIYNMGNLDTSEVTNLSQFFHSCDSLCTTGYDISGFNTRKVTNFDDFFRWCGLDSGETSGYIDISMWDTRNAHTYARMFFGCSAEVINLGALYTGGYTTEDGTNGKIDITEMFSLASSLRTIYSVNDFDMENTVDYLYDGNNSVFAIGIPREEGKNLTGQNGTICPALVTDDAEPWSKTYARIDGGPKSKTPGYFTQGTSNTTKYTIDKSKMWASLQSLSSTNPTAIKFTNGSASVLSSCTLKTAEIQADGSGPIGVYQSSDNSTIYIAPTDGSSKIMYAPYDSENFLRNHESCANISTFTSIDLSNLSTVNTVNFYSMFRDNANVTSITGISHITTDNATLMAWMFYGCNSLASIDLSRFNTSNVTDMHAMFYNCNALKTLGLRNFSTSKVTNMDSMFYGCNSLISLYISNFDTSSVAYMKAMFDGCKSLTSLDVSSFNTTNVTNMNYMFRDCVLLTALDVSKFNTAKVTDMRYMFYGCSALTSLDLSSFNTANVTAMGDMFYYCRSLTSLNVSKFSTSKVTDMSWMFANCTTLPSIDVSSFDTSSVTNMYSMFRYNSKLKTIYASYEFDTSAVTSSTSMFAGCTSLVGGSGTKYNSANIDKTYARPDFGPNSDMPGYFTLGVNYNIDKGKMWTALKSLSSTNPTTLKFVKGNDAALTSCTLKVAEIQEDGSKAIGVYQSSDNTTIYIASTDGSPAALFAPVDCYEFLPSYRTGIDFTTIICDNLNTSKTMYMEYMFYGNLTTLDVSNFYTANVTTMYCMFECPKLRELDLSSFNTTNVSEIGGMFSGCSSLGTIFVSAEGFNINRPITESSPMFSGCGALIGENGTTFNENHTDKTYARIDGGPDSDTPGYFSVTKTDYTINRYKMWTALQNLSSSNPTTLKFVKGNDAALASCTPKAEVQLGATTVPIEVYQSSDNTTIYIAPSDGSDHVMYAPADCSYFLSSESGYTNTSTFTSISLDNLDTSDTTSMMMMFASNHVLTSLDVSHLSTVNVTDMSYMFYDCWALQSINLSSFSTEKVTKMFCMFYLAGLRSIDVSSFDTSNVTTMEGMFASTYLTSIDISNFNTSKVTSMNSMFIMNANLVTIYVSATGLDTSAVTDSTKMFYKCTSLVGGNGTTYNADNLDKTYARIDGGPSSATPGYFTAK